MCPKHTLIFDSSSFVFKIVSPFVQVIEIISVYKKGNTTVFYSYVSESAHYHGLKKKKTSLKVYIILWRTATGKKPINQYYPVVVVIPACV